MDTVFCIILNWNGADDTINCIYSILNQNDINLRIVVVDNGSQDYSVSQLKQAFSEIVLIENKHNLGYAGGMNIGINYALSQQAKKILLLNNDIIADPNMVKNLYANLSERNQIIGPAIYYYDKPNKIWSIGGNINPILLELTKPHGGEIALPKHPIQREFLSGCALLIGSSVFETIGLFDEVFYPGYYEDLDFCLRVKEYGMHMLMVPEAIIYHKISQSSGGGKSNHVLFLMGRNSAIYFKKHMKLWNVFFILFFRMGSALKKTILFLLNRNIDELIAYWFGLINGWTGLLKGTEKKYLRYYSPDVHLD